MKKWYAIIGVGLLAVSAVLVFTGCELFGAQPEVKVEWVDNRSVSLNDTVQCGDVTVNKSEVCQFEISNEGGWTFTLQDIKSSNPDKFEVVQDGVGQLSPGVFESFSVHFNPPGAGSYETEISIHFKNADPYTFQMEGNGVEPDFEIRDVADVVFESEEDIYLGTYNQNDSAPMIEFPISNVGEGTLEIGEISSDPSGHLDHAINQTTLQPEESTNLEITPQTDETGNLYITVTINTNDPKDEQFTIYYYWTVN